MQNTRFQHFYRLRGVLMAPWLVFMFFCTYRECEAHWLMAVALLVFGAGLSIRIWAQMHLHYRLKVRKILTKTGPYRFVRNPIYIANTLILLGACFMSELLWLAPFLLVWCAVMYSLVVRHEERHLATKYGKPYLEYCKIAPRWFPRLKPAAQFKNPFSRTYFMRSVGAEVYCFLYILPFVAKEIASEVNLF